MKKIFILFVVLAIVSTTNAQSISRKVVSNAGGTLTGGSSQITFTIGETFIPSLSSGAVMITQGFEQPGEKIKTGSVASTLCAASSFSLPYTATDIGGGNTFTAQLSNASGSFASPINIGTLAGNTSTGGINVTIPSNAIAGTGYRIRITSSSPVFIGTNNGANIKINAAPIASISYNGSPYCAVGSASVTRSGQWGGTYASSPGLNINSSTGGINLETSTAGTYTVIYSFSNGSCTNTATTSVTINAIPLGPIVSAQNLCSSATVASLPNGGGTYKWYSTSSVGTALLSSNTLSTRTYYVSRTTGSCESSRTAVSITILSNVIAGTISGPTSICNATSVTYTRSGTSGGSWSSTSPSVATVNASTGLVTAVNSGNTSIQYTVSSGCGSPVTSSKVVTVNALPTASISYGNSQFCSNTGNINVSRTGQSGGTFSAFPTGLSINSSNGKVNLKNSSLGTYTVVYTFSNGTCSNTATTNISIIVCNNIATVVSSKTTSLQVDPDVIPSKFDVIIYPNPSSYQFTLVLEGGSNEKVEILVYDMLGQLVKRIERNSEEVIKFGEDLREGSYITIISQGTNRKTVRLMKQ